MQQFPCPWCGPRADSEFQYTGDAGVLRPARTASDAEWAQYLFMRKNPKGVHFERWVHRLGCRRWFNMARHTVTHDILAVYKMGEAPPPELATAAGMTNVESRTA